MAVHQLVNASRFEARPDSTQMELPPPRLDLSCVAHPWKVGSLTAPSVVGCAKLLVARDRR